MEEITIIITDFMIEYMSFINLWYISIFGMISFGLMKSNMFDWYKNLKFIPTEDKNRIWITGLIIMGGFLLFVSKESLDWSKPDTIKHYIGGLAQSYFIVIVFHNTIFKFITKKLNKIHGKD